MSVVLGQEVLKHGRSAESVLGNRPSWALAAVEARTVRSLGLIIVRKPEPDEPAHAEVIGAKSRKVKRDLARAATWVIPPPNTGGPGGTNGLAGPEP